MRSELAVHRRYEAAGGLEREARVRLPLIHLAIAASLTRCMAKRDCQNPTYGPLYSRCPREFDDNDRIWLEHEPIALPGARSAEAGGEVEVPATSVLIHSARLTDPPDTVDEGNITDHGQRRPAADVTIRAALAGCE